MLTHIVLLRFENMSDAQEGKKRLLSMKNKIPAMLDIEAGVDVTRSQRAYELALITRHANQEGLDAYQDHPAHQKVLEYLKTHSSGSVSVDFVS